MRLEHLIFGTASVVTVVGAVTGSERLQQVAKPLIAPSLAAGVIRRGTNADSPLLIGGLAAATIGDILLVDPDDDTRLVRGATAFAGMQAAYTALLLRHGARPTVPAVAPRVVGWTAAAVLLRARARPVSTPLTAYGVTLASATSLASDPDMAPGADVVAGLAVPNADPRSRLGLGALLFTVSDGLIVVRRLFVRGEKGRRIAEGAILATYAAAQLFLVEGMGELAASSPGAGVATRGTA